MSSGFQENFLLSEVLSMQTNDDAFMFIKINNISNNALSDSSENSLQNLNKLKRYRKKPWDDISNVIVDPNWKTKENCGEISSVQL